MPNSTPSLYLQLRQVSRPHYYWINERLSSFITATWAFLNQLTRLRNLGLPFFLDSLTKWVSLTYFLSGLSYYWFWLNKMELAVIGYLLVDRNPTPTSGLVFRWNSDRHSLLRLYPVNEVREMEPFEPLLVGTCSEILPWMAQNPWLESLDRLSARS